MTTDVNVTRCRQILKANLLVVLTFVGAAVGFGIGIGVRQYSPSDDTLMWIGILGEMYLNMLKMMIVPLVVCSVISGTASLDPRSNGKISVVSLSFIMISNFIPCLIGALVCLTIKPGSISRDVPVDAAGQTNIGTQDIFADLLSWQLVDVFSSVRILQKSSKITKRKSEVVNRRRRDNTIAKIPLWNLFPDNLIAATFQKRQTEYTTARQLYNSTLNGTIISKIHTVVIDKKVGVAPSTNILGLLIASCMFGIATGAAKEVGRPFATFFYSATEIILLVMGKVIWTTPVGVASLIGKTLASTQNLEDDFSRLGLFIGTVMIGLAILTFICVPLTYFIFTRSKPFKFMVTMLQPGMIVMATASTAIAMPETIRQLENYNGVNSRISRFVCPLCAAIGRCGSCLFICVSCLFIMQMINRDIDAATVTLVVILTTFSSLAIPAVTGASLVTVIILLTALSIPAEAASLLYAFDWFLDRMRSTTNVYVQGLCGVVTDRICRSSLNNMEEKTETTKDIAVVQEENKLPLGQKSDHQIQNDVTMYSEKL